MNSAVLDFSKELESMQPVKTTLFQKQNASVFDKLCLKLNNLFANFCEKVTSPSEDAIKFLEDLKKFAEEMKVYKEYLIHVAETSESLGQMNQVPSVQTNEPVQNVAPVANVAPTDELTVDKQKVLQLTDLPKGTV